MPVQDALVRPPVDPYVPASQLAHTAREVTLEDVAPGSAYLPAGQLTAPLQADVFKLTADPNVPAGHREQTAEDEVSLEVAPGKA